MNQGLHAAFVSGSMPFNQCTAFTTPSLSLDELLEIQRITLNFLELYYPNDHLFVFDDWHQHDGFISSERPVNRNELESYFVSTETLLKTDQGDYCVAKAVFPENMMFLWRWNIEDETDLPDGDLWCSWDFTACVHEISEMLKFLTGVRGVRFEHDSALNYFTIRYRG
jgi:hypothetical protein